MTPSTLIAWFRCAAPGESIAYHSGPRETPPVVFATALQFHREGKAVLYQKHGQHMIRKISTRAKRFIDRVSASVPAPPMGPFGRYAAGLGEDPGPFIERRIREQTHGV